MSKDKKRVVKRPKPVPKPAPKLEPSWDKATWGSLANVRLGVPTFVVAGALSGFAPNVKITESVVKQKIEDFLKQSL